MATNIPPSARREPHVSRLVALFAALLVATAPAWSQQRDRAAEIEIARELMALELAGWRLPDPVEECLTELPLSRLEPMAFGAQELIDQPELVDPPGPNFRNLTVEPEPGDAKRLMMRFEWITPDPAGRSVFRADSMVFVINELRAGKASVSVVREPRYMVVRRECFGG